MILQFAFHIIIIFIIWPIYPLAIAQDNIIAQPGCDSRCGTVKIAYPFGMKDPKCYAGKWFEIECRNSTPSYGDCPTPYLKSMNLEVMDFYELSSGKIMIINPVFHWNCQGKTNKPAINMRGSPFVYSKDDNKFVAAGCNNLAFLRSNGSTVGGCVSICDDKEEVNNDNINLGNDGCHGRYCCETSLPVYLSEYNATLEDLRNKSVSQCSYALIVTDDWLRGYYMYDMQTKGFSELKNRDFVPAVLEWEILNEMLINSTLKLPSDSYCYDSNVTASSQNKTSASGRRCLCPSGYDGNPYIAGGCTRTSTWTSTGRTSGKEGLSKFMVGGWSSLGSIILLIGLWWLYEVVRKRVIKKHKEKFFKQHGGLLLQQRLSSGEVSVERAILFSLMDLERATDHFNINRVLGKGGQGTVYKGMLVDGRIVAVKKFKVQGKVEEFINEFVILSQINHRNVVKLLGCCLETEIPLLVYEFIPNGNLFQYLHDQNEDLPMIWDMRLRIATEIAGALFYLHSVASQPIYHRDVKSTNILLDEKYRAKVADFGTSRIISIEATHLTTVVQGTFGYLDPEYFHTSQFTEKSDVYSFGVVLAELLTGQKPISLVSSEEAKNLASYFALSMEDNHLFEIIDKRVAKEGEKEHIIGVANLAYRCLELNGRKRPTMREVTLELERIQGLDRKLNAQQNLHEEIELARIEDYQPSYGYSTSNTLPTLSRGTISSEVMPVLTSNTL